MSAFVPGAGLPLSSSRVFVSGANAIGTNLTPRRTQSANDASTSTEISAIKIPSLPNLPKLPNLPNLPNPLKGKKKAPPAAPAPPKPAPVAEKLNIGGRSVAPAPPKPQSAGKGALADGIPKFYNPSTSRAEFRATAKGQNSTPFDRRIGNYKLSNNRRVNEQDTFRNMDPYTDDLLWARPGWSSDEARVGVRTAFKNILGNAHLFDSELAELSSSISCVTETSNMKEFVRAIGLSSLYRTRFFESTSNTRFVECNFKHFLGRAPRNQEEISEHIKIISEEGYNAEINSYVDSDEYDTLWGESRIPAVNFRGGHPYNNDMNKLAILSGGFSSSDRIAKRAFLQTGEASGFSPYAVFRGLPEAWRGENAARDQAGPMLEFDPDIFWNPQPAGLRSAEIAWASRFGVWNKFWYKDSIVYKEVMNPKTANTVEEIEEAEAILKYGSNMAKSYIGCRKAFDVAPVIDVRPPTSSEVMNGQLSVKMSEITFAIPSELQQKV